MGNLRFFIALLMIGVYPLHGQAQGSGSAGKRMNAQYNAVIFDVSGSNRSLSIKVGSQNRHDVIALKLLPAGEKVKAMGWALTYNKAGGAGTDIMNLKGLASVESLPASSFAFDGSELIVRAAGQSSLVRTVLHLSLPSELAVSLYVDNRLLSAGPLSKDTLIKGGRIIAARHAEPRMALMEAMMTPPENVPVANDEDVVVPPPATHPDLPWQAGWSKIERLVIDSPVPAYSGGRQGDCVNCHFAVLEIVLGKEGQITEGARLAGGNEVAGVALQALRQWRFRPFLVDGKPVKVKAVVSVRVTDGRLLFGEKAR